MAAETEQRSFEDVLQELAKLRQHLVDVHTTQEVLCEQVTAEIAAERAARAQLEKRLEARLETVAQHTLASVSSLLSNRGVEYQTELDHDGTMQDTIVLGQQSKEGKHDEALPTAAKHVDSSHRSVADREGTQRPALAAMTKNANERLPPTATPPSVRISEMGPGGRYSDMLAPSPRILRLRHLHGDMPAPVAEQAGELGTQEGTSPLDAEPLDATIPNVSPNGYVTVEITTQLRSMEKRWKGIQAETAALKGLLQASSSATTPQHSSPSDGHASALPQQQQPNCTVSRAASQSAAAAVGHAPRSMPATGLPLRSSHERLQPALGSLPAQQTLHEPHSQPRSQASW